MNPSGFRPAQGKRYSLRKVRPGLFSVSNAYKGSYEFFKGRPISKVVVNPVAAQKHSGTSPIVVHRAED